MLAVGGGHLRDAMTRAVEIVLAILISHYGVVDKGVSTTRRLSVHETAAGTSIMAIATMPKYFIQFVSSVYLLYFFNKKGES